MIYNNKTREIFILDILNNMAQKLNNEYNFIIKIEKQDYAREFGYKFKINMLDNIHIDEYDKFIEAKNFVNDMFTFIFNSENISFSMLENKTDVEFEIFSSIEFYTY